MALKLFVGRGNNKTYPTKAELIEFGHRVCGVAKPQVVLSRIAQAMHETLQSAATDERVTKDLLAQLKSAWQPSLTMYVD